MVSIFFLQPNTILQYRRITYIVLYCICITKGAREHCHSSQQIPPLSQIVQSMFFRQQSNKNNELLILTSSRQFFWPLLLSKLFMSCVCLGWLVQSRKKNKTWSGNVGFSWSRIFSGFHGYPEILCRRAELSVSITKRLISIKVLVQEEVLEAFRSAGSCATEGQSKCVIAVIS